MHKPQIYRKADMVKSLQPLQLGGGGVLMNIYM